MMSKTVLYRESDAENRSYSLLQRLSAGKYLFVPEVEDYRKFNGAGSIFWDAMHLVFKDRLFANAFLGAEPDEDEDKGDENREKKEEEITPTQNEAPLKYYNEYLVAPYVEPGYNEAEDQNKQPRIKRQDRQSEALKLQGKKYAKDAPIFYKKQRATPGSPLNRLLTAGYWNPFAWLEALSLFWVNSATYLYDPLTQGYTVSGLCYFHIILASTAYAVAKTANLVLTPLALILVASAALSYGLTPALMIASGLGILFALGSWAYHSYQYWNLPKTNHPESEPNDKSDPSPSLAFCVWQGFLHMGHSLFTGIAQPLLHLYDRAKDLRQTHPVLFWAGVVVTILAVLAVGVFPYTGAPSVLGWKLGTVIYNVLEPGLHVLSSYFTLTPTEVNIFKGTVAGVATLGVVDLVSRAMKEMGGWWDGLKASWSAEEPSIPTKNISYGSELTIKEVRTYAPNPNPENPYRDDFVKYERVEKATPAPNQSLNKPAPN